ncbi:hypothetical protein B0H11DRAFT_2216084 [Mycena galericulata]|nr:hypothetical protein B0H11DRAFT_2216084 [Mycena galericulata]
MEATQTNNFASSTRETLPITDADLARKIRALERAKAVHLVRQLQLRLQYAKLKVDHGWQKQHLNEVENLYFRQQRHSDGSVRTEYPSTAVLTTPMDPQVLAQNSMGPNNNSSLSFKLPAYQPLIPMDGGLYAPSRSDAASYTQPFFPPPQPDLATPWPNLGPHAESYEHHLNNSGSERPSDAASVQSSVMLPEAGPSTQPFIVNSWLNLNPAPNDVAGDMYGTLSFPTASPPPPGPSTAALTQSPSASPPKQRAPLTYDSFWSSHPAEQSPWTTRVTSGMLPPSWSL